MYKFIMLVLCLGLFAGIASSQSTQQEPPANPGQPPPVLDPDESAAPPPPTIPPSMPPSAYRFTPSEKMSADDAVAFPVDI